MNGDYTIHWRIQAVISPRNLAEVLYHLNFHGQDFSKLPDHVQESYCRDAVTILQRFGAKPANE